MEILQSRRFWAAVIGFVFQVAVMYLPDIGTYAPQLQEYSLYVVLALIGGYSLEDTVSAFARKYGGQVIDLVQDVLEDVKPPAVG